MELQPKILAFIEDLTRGAYHEYSLLIEDICKKLTLECFLADFEDKSISGAIFKNDNDNKFSIYVARQHSANRRRFTIAHEIGHYISFKNDSFSKDGFVKNNGFEDYSIMYRAVAIHSDAETEANQIAAEMLMPRLSVEKLVASKTSIEKMAELFFVSEIAMAIRLQHLYKNIIIT